MNTVTKSLIEVIGDSGYDILKGFPGALTGHVVWEKALSSIITVGSHFAIVANPRVTP